MINNPSYQDSRAASEPVGWDSPAEGGRVSVDESGVSIRRRQGMSADLVVIQ